VQIAATPVDNMVLRNYKSPLLLLVIDVVVSELCSCMLTPVVCNLQHG